MYFNISGLQNRYDCASICFNAHLLKNIRFHGLQRTIKNLLWQIPARGFNKVCLTQKDNSNGAIKFAIQAV